MVRERARVSMRERVKNSTALIGWVSALVNRSSELKGKKYLPGGVNEN